MQSIRSIAIGAIMSIALPLTAQAATIFTDRASFEAATGGGLATETFDTPIATAAFLTFDGGITASRTGTNSPNQVINGRFSTLVTRNQNNLVTLDFGQEINAFGADFSDAASLFADLVGTGESVTIRSSFIGAGFFGFISDESFSSLTFRTATGIGFGSQVFSLDNLSSGTAMPDVAPVPLPAGLPLLLTAFGGIAFLRRRRAN